MDKQTLSHYGWIVVAALVIAVMLSFATPFGEYVMDGVSSIAKGLIDTKDEAFSDEHKNDIVNKWEDKWTDLDSGYTVEQLQRRYKFEYYSTLHGAINDINNSTIGSNADIDKAKRTIPGKAYIYQAIKKPMIFVLFRDF